MVCIFASLSTTRISGELFSLLLCYLLKVPRLRPPSLSFQPTEGACCLSVLLSKKARAEESFLPRPVAPSFARPPMQPLYSLLTVGPKSVFFIGVCLRCGFLISCFAFCSHTCYSSAYSQCSHDSFAMRRKSWEPHMDGRFQLGMSLREVRPGTSLTAGPHPGAVDVSGLFHQTVTNCRGRESVCGLWPLPFHFFSSCAGIASLAPSDATQPTHLHPRSFREVERGPPRRRDIQHRHFTVAIISCEMLTMMCGRRVMRMAQFIIAILV